MQVTSACTSRAPTPSLRPAAHSSMALRSMALGLRRSGQLFSPQQRGQLLFMRRAAATTAEAEVETEAESFQEEGGPKIGEVPYQQDCVNGVNLMGRLGMDIELVTTSTGRTKGSARVAVRVGGDNTEWHSLEVWGQLALDAKAELKKGDRIQVFGKLRVGEWVDQAGTKRERTRVVADDIFRVIDDRVQMGQEPPSEVLAQQKYLQPDTSGAPSVYSQGDPQLEEAWRSVVDNPRDWWDNRVGKRNPKAPDFKRKDPSQGGLDALWLDSFKTPAWVPKEVAKIPPPNAARM